jgi:hypothetical protein
MEALQTLIAGNVTAVGVIMAAGLTVAAGVALAVVSIKAIRRAGK